MSQRGPDGQKMVYIKNDNNNIYLFHSRLSIIDLDKRSDQPYFFENYTIVFNGEIYNYIELRDELKKKGRVFKTDSDTEVLIQCYEEFGEDCLQKFEGMWSFALWDGNQNKLFLSRDRFGEKPLYYYETSDGIYFGSQTLFIKSLVDTKIEVNQNQILRYLVNGYRSLYQKNETYYKKLYEIPIASLCFIDVDLQLYTTKFWTLKPNVDQKMSTKDAIEGVKERLIDSMRLRLRSDVPIAFCLSGGIDSTALASIASKVFHKEISTFSIIDEDIRYNEYENINHTVNDLKCKSTKIHLEKGNNLDKLIELIKFHDAPIATISYLVHSLLSEEINKNGFKVAISGTGADELFTGYYDHFNFHIYDTRNSPLNQHHITQWETHIQNIVRNPYLSNPKIFIENPYLRDHIFLNNDIFSSYTKSKFEEKFTEYQFETDSMLQNRMMNELFFESTRVIIHQDDLNSMKNSIENRSPFLDTNLVEFAYSIPPELLIQNGYGKYILRESLSGILNDEVRLDRRKKGFNASLNSLFNLKDLKTRDFLLSESEVFDIVDKSFIESLLEKDTLENSFSKFLFNYLCVKIFLDFS